MYNLTQHIHFVGIGGVGMAGIAEVLHSLGYSVGGSDVRESALITRLRELGIGIAIGHSAENIPLQTAVVVVSTAVASSNVEVTEATRRKIPVIPRAAMLAELMRTKYGIAVAGSHGKTSTTTMIAKVLGDNGIDPTVIVGGRVMTQSTGARLGLGSFLVAEADESDGSFCMLRPAIAIVTNIDAEHLSHYGSFGALEAAFARFLSEVPFYGLVVACIDDPVVRRIIAPVQSSIQRRTVTFGLSPNADLQASEISMRGATSQFRLHLRGQDCGVWSLPAPGAHMVSNSLAAIAVGLELGLFLDEIKSSLAKYPGVSRRTELLARSDGIVVLDDYAHHPKEISATLSAVRTAWLQALAEESGQKSSGKVIAIFQPHRYSRTKELFSDFLTCFTDADKVIVTEIYPAGEESIPGISARELAAAMQHPDVTFIADPSEIVQKVAGEVSSGDVVITVGAGSVGAIAHRFADLLGERSATVNGAVAGRSDAGSQPNI